MDEVVPSRNLVDPLPFSQCQGASVPLAADPWKGTPPKATTHPIQRVHGDCRFIYRSSNFAPFSMHKRHANRHFDFSSGSHENR